MLTKEAYNGMKIHAKKRSLQQSENTIKSNLQMNRSILSSLQSIPFSFLV